MFRFVIISLKYTYRVLFYIIFESPFYAVHYHEFLKHYLFTTSVIQSERQPVLSYNTSITQQQSRTTVTTFTTVYKCMFNNTLFTAQVYHQTEKQYERSEVLQVAASRLLSSGIMGLCIWVDR
jgi:hypothetical protein